MGVRGGSRRRAARSSRRHRGATFDSSRRPVHPSSRRPVVPSPRRSVVPSSRRPVVPSSRRPPGPGTDNLIGLQDSTGTQYYGVQDQLGSVRRLVRVNATPEATMRAIINAGLVRSVNV